MLPFVCGSAPRDTIRRMSDPISDEGLYDFAPETPARRPPTKIQVKPLPVVTPDAPAVLGYRNASADKSNPVDPDQIKNVNLPLGLLAGGVFVELLSAVIWTHHLGSAIAELGLDLTVGTGVMLGAMMIAAKLRGIDLGKLGVAAYKLAAISVAPVAAMEFINPIARFIPFGGLIGFVVEFILFFALLGALFDLDESDTWYCVCVMFITRVGLYFALSAIFPG
jgi:hypothetical protein